MHAASGGRDRTRWSRLWWATLAALSIVLVLPLFLIDVPPVLDYPNHLARMYVLAFPDDPVLSHIYATRWSVIPNLAIDLLVPPLLHVLPAHVGGRIMLASALLLPVWGCAAYNRAAFGRYSVWPFAAGVMAYNALFLLGFLNFQIGMGVALFAAAAWCARVDAHPVTATITGAVCAVALFFCHIFGVVLFGILIGCREAALLWQHRGLHSALVRAAMLLAVFAIPMALYAIAPLRDAGGPTVYLPIGRKLAHLLAPFADYDVRLTLITAGGVAGILYVLIRTGAVRTAPGTTLAAFILVTAYPMLPDIAHQGAFIDSRVPIMLGLVLFAGVAPLGLPRRETIVVTLLAITLILLHVASVADVWTEHTRDLADFRATVAPVQAGAKVLVVTGRPVDPHGGSLPDSHKNRALPGYMILDTHMPALLVLEHRAFWPLLFTAGAQQPVTVLPPYDRLSIPIGEVPPLSALTEVPSARDLQGAPYLADWQHHFDYVLLLDAGAAGDIAAVAPDKLELLHATDIAALFRVRRP